MLLAVFSGEFLHFAPFTFNPLFFNDPQASKAKKFGLRRTKVHISALMQTELFLASLARVFFRRANLKCHNTAVLLISREKSKSRL